jgi:hypothetical protein
MSPERFACSAKTFGNQTERVLGVLPLIFVGRSADAGNDGTPIAAPDRIAGVSAPITAGMKRRLSLALIFNGKAASASTAAKTWRRRKQQPGYRRRQAWPNAAVDPRALTRPRPPRCGG